MSIGWCVIFRLSRSNGIVTDRNTAFTRKRSIALVIGLIGVALLSYAGLLARDVLRLRDEVQALQAFAAALPARPQPAQIDLKSVQPRLTALRDDLAAFKSHAGPLLALTPLLGWLPQIGGDVRAAPALLDMAWEAADAAERAVNMIAPLWPPADNDRFSLEAMTRILQVLQPAMDSFDRNLDRAEAARRSIDTAALSPRVKSVIDRYDAAYPALSAGLQAAAVAPQLLGADRPRTYLLLLQNEDELRATGGFISAAGLLTLDAGRIVTLTMEDAYAVDDFSRPYPDPPAPLLDLMGATLWVFRDTNWSPDFPTAARQAIELYTLARPGQIDGVIALNQNVIQAVADGLGALDVNPGQPPLPPAALRDYLHRAWAPAGQTSVAEWYVQRKEFIGRVMQTMLHRLLNDPRQVDWRALGGGLQTALAQRDLMIWADDPHLNARLAAAGWDGSLAPVDGDYLMIVDSNVGFNKANAAVRESIEYAVTIAPDGGVARLTLTYTQTGQPIDACRHELIPYTLDLTYDQLVQQCYWNYRRVLVPSGAALLDASRPSIGPVRLITGRVADGATAVGTELDRASFNTLVVVPRGASISGTLRYALPGSIITPDGAARTYRLRVQKQSGAGPWPLTVRLSWPAGWRLLDSEPPPSGAAAQSAVYDRTLDQDQVFTLRFAPAPADH